MEEKSPSRGNGKPGKDSRLASTKKDIDCLQNPQSSVRRKTTSIKERKAKPHKTGKLQSFCWWHPGRPKQCEWFHSIFMKFVKSSPEHLGKLEQEMKPLANIRVERLFIKVTAKAHEVEKTWQKRSDTRLNEFFLPAYAVRTQLVQHYDSNMLIDAHTLVQNLPWMQNGKYEIAVCGLAKDVEKKIQDLKYIDESLTARRVMVFEDQMRILPEHCNRLQPASMENIARKSDVLLDWMSPSVIYIRGDAPATKQARQMIIDEIFCICLRKICCPRWLFDNLTSEFEKARLHFPEIEIRHENDELCVKGHPHEVKLVENELTAQMEFFDERVLQISDEYYGLIIGKGGKSVKELEEKCKVSISIPFPSSKQTSIFVRGERHQTEAAEKEILQIVDTATKNKRSSMCLKASDLTQNRITQDVLTKVQCDTGVVVTWKNSEELLFFGPKDKLKPAKKLLVNEATAIETKTIKVETWLHKYLEGFLLDSSSRWPQVKWKILDSEIALSGQRSEVGSFFRQLSAILADLRGKMTCTSLLVRKDFHKNITGKHGENIRDLKKRYKVEILFPEPDVGDLFVKIEGKKESVAAAVNEINKLIRLLESSVNESIPVPHWMMHFVTKAVEEAKRNFPRVKVEKKNDQIILSGDVTDVQNAKKKLMDEMEHVRKSNKIVIVPLSHNQLLGLIGHKRKNWKILKNQFSSVHIAYTQDLPSLTIKGEREAVEMTHVHIVEIVQKYVDFCVMEVKVENQYIGRIIGRGGSRIDELRTRYSGVTEIDTPNKNQENGSVFISGDYSGVNELSSFFQMAYGAEKIGCKTKLLHGNDQDINRALDRKRGESYESMASFKSVDFSNDDILTSTERAIYYDSWHPEQLCLLTFVKGSSYVANGLKELMGDSVSLVITESKIQIAGQARTDDEYLWVCNCITKLEQFFSSYSCYTTVIHPLSSVNRDDLLNDDLKIVWDEGKTQVTVSGIRRKVEEKKAEFEEIMNITKPVNFSYSCNGYIISYLKGNLESLPKSLGQVTLNTDNITINADVLETCSTEEWEAEQREVLKKILDRYLHRIIPVPLLFAGKMRGYCITDESSQVVISWENKANSLVVYGCRDGVEVKADFLKKELDKIKNKKKNVSWKFPCANKDIFLFVKESKKFITELITCLDDLGSPYFSEGIVTINGAILEINSTQEWENKCHDIVEEFFSQFHAKRLPVLDSIAKTAVFLLVENRTSVSTRWLEEKKCLLICGTSSDVNMRVAMVKTALKELVEKSVVTDSSAAMDVNSMSPEDFTSVLLRLSNSEVKRILTPRIITDELRSVSFVKDENGIRISGRKSCVEKAASFIRSMVVEELEIMKYGAYQFLTDSTTGMQILLIAMRHSCAIHVEKIPDSKWGNKSFVLVPDGGKENSKTSIFGNLTVEVAEGDITSEKVDVIVNTSDKSFSFNGELSRAMFRRAGDHLKSEFYSDKIDEEMGFTAGGSLTCKKILHVAIPAKHESMEFLVVKILKKADELCMKTITLPAIGAGGGGWRYDVVADGMRKGIRNFSESTTPKHLQKIRVMLFPAIKSANKTPFYDKLMNTSAAAATQQDSSGFLSRISGIFSMLRRPSASPAPVVNKAEKSAPRNSGDVENDGGFAKIIISLNNQKVVETAKQEVMNFVDRYLKEYVVKNPSVLQLSKTDIDKMEKIADQQKVRIIVNRKEETHSITIQGSDECALNAKCDIELLLPKISTDLPGGWSSMEDREKLSRVCIETSSEEYAEVEKKFLNANQRWMYESYTVTKIERVQNPFLYGLYQLKKTELAGRSSAVEKELFHATDEKTVEEICLHGFNRNYAGRNATAYGKGVYFSTQSSYSNAYARQNGCGEKQMFLAKVLTGDYCQGDSSMRDPPKNLSTNEPYDSAVDDVQNPTIFVVFRDWSVYPSYVITYK